MLTFDHLVLGVQSLDEAAAEVVRRHGFASLPGGRHPGHGTGNRIVPMGADYLELMGITDPGEAAHSPLGTTLEELVEHGDRLIGICLRTDDIDALSRRLGIPSMRMSRETPSGHTLTWRLLGMEQMLEDGRPFFIQWDVPPDLHPGRSEAPHRVDPLGIEWVEIGGDVEALSHWIGDHDLDLRLRPFGGRRLRAAIRTVDGRVTL
jgi:hypothetical protein